MNVSTPAATGRSLELGQVLEGERLDHFEIQRFVGGGGMGAVFQALDTTLNRVVALKVLARETAADDETVRRFQNEAQSAARLDHENIARVFYVGEDKGLHYIAFEFIEGTNIRDLVDRRGPLPLGEALRYTLQVAEALAHASSRDVVHRDIKPSNVLITSQGRAKLVDMGLARLHQVTQSSDDLTASGVTLGTFDYISPEQARDPRLADVRSDIYSLGCTLYYMLTARPPFPEGTVLQKLLQHQGDDPVDPREFQPDLPPEVSRIILKMLAKDPRRRYQSANELVGDLLLLCNQLGMHTGEVVWVGPGESTRVSFFERHLPWMAPVATLLVIFLILQLSSQWSSRNSGLLETEPYAARLPDREASQQKADAAQAGLENTRVPAPSVSGPRTSDAAQRPSTESQNSNATERPSAVTSPNTTPRPAADASQDSQTAPPLPIVDTTLPRPEAEIPSDEIDLGGPIDPPIPTVPSPESAPIEGRLAPDPVFGGSSVGEFSGGASVDPAPRAESTDSSNDPGFTATLPSERTEREAPVDPPMSAPSDVLVVADRGDGRTRFTTLRAACAVARDGDVIELRFNDRREEKPLELSSNLTIRAGEGFRPVIVFRPAQSDPVGYARDMIRVVGGRLALVRLTLELDLPADQVATENWSLIASRRAESIQLEGCWLTVRGGEAANASYHVGPAIFDVQGPPGGDAMTMSDDGMTNDGLHLRLSHCVARGEALFLRVGHPEPITLQWNNGLLTTSERFLVASGGSSAPRVAGPVRIDLQHVTMVAQNGFCLLNGGPESPHQLDTVVHCANSIFVSLPESPLIEQQGIAASRPFDERVRWESDRVFFDGVRTFWKVVPVVPGEPPKEIQWSGWRSFWGGRGETWGSIKWQHPLDLDRLPHEQVVEDFLLDPKSPAHAAATDGLDAGMLAGQLPALASGNDAASNRSPRTP